MKWFSFRGIATEIRRIRWPSVKELTQKSGKSLLFILLFMGFFVLCELLISWVMSLMGIV